MNLNQTLLAAAISGILAGVTGCGGAANPEGASAPMAEGAKHACKGQGGCKTDTNGCKGQNACKGQGGCKTA